MLLVAEPVVTEIGVVVVGLQPRQTMLLYAWSIKPSVKGELEFDVTA